jgi:NAD(P)-dependent dehydrogenase (short-subunit alcohol dehydrogenase family)
MFSLSNKTALITGAGRGVGLGIATALAQQGAKVLINDIDTQRANTACQTLAQQGLIAEAVVFDVTCQAAVNQALAGRDIDILVNNAGNAGAESMPQMPLAAMDATTVDRFIDVNLKGVIYCCQAVIPGMQQRNWGRLITISSEAGRSGLNIGVSVYGAAKAGAASLMRHLSQELGGAGITANTIYLGLMDNLPAEFASKLVRGIPAGRLGSPADAGALAVYLASEEAAWFTGQSIGLNGGASTH